MHMQIGTHTDLYIGGAWRIGASRRPVLSPITGQTLAMVSHADAADVELALDAASDALPAWKITSPSDRSEYLGRVAELVRSYREPLIELQMHSCGKPRQEAEIDVDAVGETFSHYATLLESSEFVSRVRMPSAEYSGRLEREPVGVAALIVPWNFPMVTTAWKLAPALAAGCTVVIKPSELTPLPELALAAILEEAGLPAGVVNFVVGDGVIVGEMLVTDRRVSKVSFTGSTAVGQRIMRLCADDLKRVSLELGGKSPIVVLADADLDLAVELICAGVFYNAGQICSATSRLIVAAGVKDDLLRRLVARVQSIVVGDPFEHGTTMGPLMNAKQFERVAAMVDSALADGGKLVCGGGSLGDGRACGLCYPPTIIDAVAAGSAMWRDEVFGPVLAVASFDSIDEAIRMANDSDYGLAASIVGIDRVAVRRLVSEIKAGFITVNAPQIVVPQLSWGGFKKSSLGRELGVEGLRSFQELKAVVADASMDLETKGSPEPAKAHHVD